MHDKALIRISVGFYCIAVEFGKTRLFPDPNANSVALKRCWEGKNGTKKSWNTNLSLTGIQLHSLLKSTLKAWPVESGNNVKSFGLISHLRWIKISP